MENASFLTYEICSAAWNPSFVRVISLSTNFMDESNTLTAACLRTSFRFYCSNPRRHPPLESPHMRLQRLSLYPWHIMYVPHPATSGRSTAVHRFVHDG
ncbi:hypothetical protein PDIG_23480 [Penicillium digitatum PHI26]|uniref:Uncharacterized protein n=2 Tax=Penicillium digitatum TaxID=36651 RepID=K9GMQ8_PEND2|nr:hypothetical protein PDIP_15890 [Penicillium digitatum Pd1]EKV15993.1 hypothetical protein PDIG_23480 [Penicillium digitatum PHI26]EKV20505.1 hypothetical protein PDIP_15890 [Penicillium digitatum Pd1]